MCSVKYMISYKQFFLSFLGFFLEVPEVLQTHKTQFPTLFYPFLHLLLAAGCCAFIRMAGIVRWSVGGACINNFTLFLPQTHSPATIHNRNLRRETIHKSFLSFLPRKRTTMDSGGVPEDHVPSDWSSQKMHTVSKGDDEKLGMVCYCMG